MGLEEKSTQKQIVIKYDDSDNMQIECDWNDNIRLVQVLAPTLGSVMQTVLVEDKELLYQYIIETQNILKNAEKINFPNTEEPEVVIEVEEEKIAEVA